MLPPFTFKATPNLIFGPDRHRQLPALLQPYGRRLLLIVGGSSFISSAEWSHLKALLIEHNFHIAVEHIRQEPSPRDIDTIWEKYPEGSLDTVVAIGGGSVLDAGKAISAMLVERQPVFTFLEGVGSRKPSGRKLPFIAVPTTSGTGSEATSNAVISQVGDNGFKKSLRHDNYIPDIAILDPVLTLSCPSSLTAACGMDAFSQLVEGYLSTSGSPLSDSLALAGIDCVRRSLVACCRDGASNLSARADLCYGAYLSGLVLANAGLGAVHGLASAVGGLFPIPHGVVCGTLMAPANRVTLEKLRATGDNPAALNKYTILGKILAADEKNRPDREHQDFCIAALENLTTTVGIGNLSDFGVNRGDVARILAQSSSKSNPVTLDPEELATILAARLLPDCR